MHYINPTDEPNAALESDMNTFLSLAKETSTLDLKDTLQFIVRVERIANAVQEVWVNSIAAGDLVKRDQALLNLQQLHQLILERLDQVLSTRINHDDLIALDLFAT